MTLKKNIFTPPKGKKNIEKDEDDDWDDDEDDWDDEKDWDDDNDGYYD